MHWKKSDWGWLAALLTMFLVAYEWKTPWAWLLVVLWGLMLLKSIFSGTRTQSEQ